LFSALQPEELQGVQFSEAALAFAGASACCILSCSSDPYFFLPAGWKAESAVALEISMLVQTTMRALVAAFQRVRDSDAEQVTIKLGQAEARWNEESEKLKQALAAAENQGQEARALAVRLEEQLTTTTVRMRQEMQREVRILQELLDSAEDRAREEAEKQEREAALENELRNAQMTLESERALLENERALRARMLRSKSWAVTKPLRGLMNLFAGGK
jgi:hypothetical protein